MWKISRIINTFQGTVYKYFLYTNFPKCTVYMHCTLYMHLIFIFHISYFDVSVVNLVTSLIKLFFYRKRRWNQLCNKNYNLYCVWLWRAEVCRIFARITIDLNPNWMKYSFAKAQNNCYIYCIYIYFFVVHKILFSPFFICVCISTLLLSSNHFLSALKC